MSETLNIRRATPADAAIVVRHKRLMFEDIGYDDHAWLDEMDIRFLGWVKEKLAQGEYLGWFVVDEAGQVVAGAGLWSLDYFAGTFDLSGKRAHIMNVYTEPAYRRRGLARQLMAEVMAWCEQHGIGSVTLNASDKGRGLYESLGFSATNTMLRVLPAANGRSG
jgi:GNAT superfamily N-acetyltransferase